MVSAAPTSGPADGQRGQAAQVADIVDGDTVDVLPAGGGAEVRVRLLGIDTPEVYGGAECWGAEASAFAEKTLGGQAVRLLADPTQDDTDRYGRSLRYLIVGSGENYSTLAAEAGAARAYIYNDTPVTQHPAISAAEDRARAAGRGLWAACSTEPTPTPAPTAKNTTPAASPTAKSTPSAGPGNGKGCAAGYSPCVPPAQPDLDCGDLDGPITVTGTDPHRLDADGDGIGCEG